MRDGKWQMAIVINNNARIVNCVNDEWMSNPSTSTAAIIPWMKHMGWGSMYNGAGMVRMSSSRSYSISGVSAGLVTLYFGIWYGFQLKLWICLMGWCSLRLPYRTVRYSRVGGRWLAVSGLVAGLGLGVFRRKTIEWGSVDYLELSSWWSYLMNK